MAKKKEEGKSQQELGYGYGIGADYGGRVERKAPGSRQIAGYLQAQTFRY